MIVDDWLLNLLDQREQHRQQGRLLSATELCADRPERLPDVEEALRRLAHVAPYLEESATSSEKFQSLGEDYQILEELGRGGMGVVYKARQVGLKRTVALKVILAGGFATTAERQRFHTEAEALARLQHPHIVQIHEVGEAQARPFFCMEYLDGGSLERKLATGPLPPRQTAELLRDLALAVQHAHDQGVLHRDLKPANILLATDGTAKVSDFGLAKIVHRAQADTTLGAQTCTGDIFGSPSYMAPEQADGRNKEAAPGTDIYGLGAILYRCLTGVAPFLGANTLDTLWQVVHVDPIEVRRRQPRVPVNLETICLKCLRKESSRRYASALELAEDLRRFLEGQPIQARPVGVAERVALWTRRQPAVAGLVGVCLLAAVALLSLGVWAYVSVSAEAERANAGEKDARDKAAHLAEANRKLQDARDLAGEVLQTTVTKIADNPQLKERGFFQLRQELLSGLLPYYHQLTEQHSKEPTQIANRARAFGILGKIYVEMGEMDKAIAHHRQMQTLFAALVRDFPEEPNYRHELANSHDALGVLLGPSRNTTAAETEFQQARALIDSLVSDYPERKSFALARISIVMNPVLLLEAAGKHREALVLVEKALHLSDLLPPAWQAEPAAQSLIAMLHYNRGFELTQLGRHEEALAPLRRAEKMLNQLLQQHPTSPDFRNRLANNLNQQGCSAIHQKNWAAAQTAFQKALAFQKGLVEEFPHLTPYQHKLAHLHSSQGDLLAQQNQLVTAEQEFLRAIPLLKNLAQGPAVPCNAREDLAKVYLGMAKLAARKKEDRTALDWLSKGIPLLEGILAENDKASHVRHLLVDTYQMKALQLLPGKQFAPALACCDRALALNQDQKQEMNLTVIRGFVMTGLRQRLKALLEAAAKEEYAKIAEEVAQLVAHPKTPARARYDAARVLAQCAGAAKNAAPEKAVAYAAEAVRLLQQAHQERFFATPELWQQLQEDETLAPLRDRPDFQAFLKSLTVGSPGPKE